MLGSPVAGRLQAYEEAWLGTPTFRVTQTFAQHPANAKGIDIGNGRCGDPVLFMEDGKVTERFADAAGALVIRYRLTKYPRYVLAHSHLASFGPGTAVGSPVTRGQVAGNLGNTGLSTACHDHIGCTLDGVEVDWWALLNQNIMGADMTIIVNATLFLGADGKPASRQVAFAAGAVITGFALDGSSEQFTAGPGGSSAPADARCAISGRVDAPVGQPFVRITAGVFDDHPYLLETQPGLTVAPDPKPTPTSPSGGFTQDDIDAAVTEAVEARDDEWEAKAITTLHP